VTARRAALYIALFAIVLGIFARTDALGRKLLWQDEAYSLLRISGHTNAELDALFDGSVRPARDVFALQEITPQRGAGDLLRSIAREEPQRGPLYYVLARAWIGVVGNGTAQVRGLSALLGVAGIGIAFALGLRAAGTLEGGALAAAFFALAPLQIRLAQQVREYVLVADLTLLSAFALSRAFEKPSWTRWAAFACCAVAGLYANVEFAFVLAFEGAVVAAFAARGAPELRRSRLAGCGACGVVAAAAYAPWLYAVSAVAGRGAGGVSWAASAYSLRSSLLKWTFNLGASFFDSEYAHPAYGVVLLPALALCAYALYRLARGPGDGFVRALGLALVASSIVPLTLLDAVQRSHYALVTRYAMSSWTGLEFALALALAWQLESARSGERRFAAAAAAFVVLLGASAYVLNRPYVEWWDNNEHLSEAGVALAARAEPGAPIVASANTSAYVLVLSRYLEGGRPLLLVRDVPARLPAPCVYLFLPSDATRRKALSLAGPGAALVDESPPVGLTIPDLRERGEAQIEAANALWRLDARKCCPAAPDRPQRAKSRRYTRGAKSASLSTRRKVSKRTCDARARLCSSAAPSSR
jgi:uncharacterized membrane protein